MPSTRFPRSTAFYLVYLFIGLMFGGVAIARGFEIANGNWHACPAGAPISRCMDSWRTLPVLYVILGAFIILFALVAAAIRLRAAKRD